MTGASDLFEVDDGPGAVHRGFEEDEFPALGDFVESLALMTEPIGSVEEGSIMYVESLDIRLPVEIDVEQDKSGQVALFAAPPTQRTETSVRPILHGFRLRMTRDHG